MTKEIHGIVPYPFDAQSNPFFCALASVLLPALGYTEETPYFCGKNECYCIHCGNCPDKSTLQKHHLNLYHTYQTFTGVSLGWDWPENDSPYQVIPGWEKGWCWPDEFFRFVFGYAGLSWQRLSKGAEKGKILAALRASINAGLPALLRLGMDWHVIAGFDGDALIGLGYGSKETAVLPGWFNSFEDGILITGCSPRTAILRDVLGRMIRTLEHPAHARLEWDVMRRIDAVSSANALETVCWLGPIAGFPPEARWHAADSPLQWLTDDAAVRQKLFGMTRQYVFDDELDATHGISNKLCRMLTLGHAKGYAVLPEAAERIMDAEFRTKLKRLFSILFKNDRIVLQLLRDAAALI